MWKLKPGDDKHIFAGMLAAFFGAALAASQMLFYVDVSWRMVGFVGFVAALVAGITNEIAQKNLNNELADADLPPIATVSGRDTLLTALPGIVLFFIMGVFG